MFGGLLLCASLAGAPLWGALPAPDYRESLVAQVEAQADARIAAGDLAGALVLIQAFRADVTDDPRLVYEEGLIRRLQGDPQAAEALYRQAVEQDPTLFYAWYDLGELLLETGELQQAEEALIRATESSGDHPQGWVGPMRLAELAASTGEVTEFETWLREALYRGFRFATVAGTPKWRQLAQNPEIYAVIERLAVVYGEEATLSGFR